MNTISKAIFLNKITYFLQIKISRKIKFIHKLNIKKKYLNIAKIYFMLFKDTFYILLNTLWT